MSIKIKVGWDNENAISESVRIYRSDSAFLSTSLPSVLAEITGDIYEYEDLATTQGNKYFYMLSAKFGEKQVFTECYEVVAATSTTSIAINFSASTQNQNWDAPVLINEPARLAGDISICVIRKIHPIGTELIVPSGWSLIFQQSFETYLSFYVLYKINTVSSDATSTQTNVTTGCSHTMIFRPVEEVTSLTADSLYAVNTAVGTSGTFNMPALQSKNPISFELNIFCWDSAYSSRQEPIILEPAYTMIQRKEVSDITGASSFCTFGKNIIDNTSVGGSEVSISGIGDNSKIYKMVFAIVAHK